MQGFQGHQAQPQQHDVRQAQPGAGVGARRQRRQRHPRQRHRQVCACGAALGGGDGGARQHASQDGHADGAKHEVGPQAGARQVRAQRRRRLRRLRQPARCRQRRLRSLPARLRGVCRSGSPAACVGIRRGGLLLLAVGVVRCRASGSGGGSGGGGQPGLGAGRSLPQRLPFVAGSVHAVRLLAGGGAHSCGSQPKVRAGVARARGRHTRLAASRDRPELEYQRAARDTAGWRRPGGRRRDRPRPRCSPSQCSQCRGQRPGQI